MKVKEKDLKHSVEDIARTVGVSCDCVHSRLHLLHIRGRWMGNKVLHTDAELNAVRKFEFDNRRAQYRSVYAITDGKRHLQGTVNELVNRSGLKYWKVYDLCKFGKMHGNWQRTTPMEIV